MSHDRVMAIGAAGFIGSSLCEALISQGRQVTDIENFSPNYGEAVKRDNPRALLGSDGSTLVECDVGREDFRRFLSSRRPNVIIHLAATPGVSPSVHHVLEYVDNNVRATANVLACAAARERVDELSAPQRMVAAYISCLGLEMPL